MDLKRKGVEGSAAVGLIAVQDKISIKQGRSQTLEREGEDN